jgi:hypothetical protein
MFLLYYKITWGKNSVTILESENAEDVSQNGALHKDEYGSNFVSVTEERNEKLCNIYFAVPTSHNSVQTNVLYSHPSLYNTTTIFPLQFC